LEYCTKKFETYKIISGNYGGNSKTYNPFSVLSNVEITKMSSSVNIDIGKNAGDKIESLARIQEIDASKNIKFRENCDRCQKRIVGIVSNNGQCEECGGFGNVDPSTPTSQALPSLVEDEAGQKGQWTCVVNKRKSKSRLPP
jgi:hypothetical protein